MKPDNLNSENLGSDDVSNENILPTDLDLLWARALSGAAKENSQHQNNFDVVNAVQKALRAEQLLPSRVEQSVPSEQSPQAVPGVQTENLESEAWTKFLARAAQLQPIDHASIAAALMAVQTERSRLFVQNRKRIGKSLAAFALVATIAGVLLLRPNFPNHIDATDAYAAYTEASSGW